MKFSFAIFFVFGMCFARVGFGQVTDRYFAERDTSEANNFTVGLDIIKNLPYLFFKNQMPVSTSQTARLSNRGIMEVAFRKEAGAGSCWVGLMGHSQTEATDPESIARHQKIQGWYAKGGREWTLGRGKGHSKIGIRGILTYARFTTDLVYEGSTFGNYEFRDQVGNVGFGFEPYYAYDFFLAPRWLLRWETRWSHHLRMIGEGTTPYYPGIGLSSGFYDYVVSGGTTLQLHYRFKH